MEYRRRRRRDVVVVSVVGVGARGAMRHVGVAVVLGKRVGGFKPRLAVKAKEAHRRLAFSSGRDGRCAFRCSVIAAICHRGVWRRLPRSGEQGQAANCQRRSRLSVAKRAEIRELVREKSGVVGVKFSGLCRR